MDPATAQRFEGQPPFKLQGQATVRSPLRRRDWAAGVTAAGSPTSARSATGLDCIYNGSRWFAGPSPANNETVDNPNGANCVAELRPGGSAEPLTEAHCGRGNLTNFNNAGRAARSRPRSSRRCAYIQLNGQWRNMDWVLPTVRRAADFNVYWGDGGLVDSVIDVTHNVAVPFQTYMGAGFGILNTGGGRRGVRHAARRCSR